MQLTRQSLLLHDIRWLKGNVKLQIFLSRINVNYALIFVVKIIVTCLVDQEEATETFLNFSFIIPSVFVIKSQKI